LQREAFSGTYVRDSRPCARRTDRFGCRRHWEREPRAFGLYHENRGCDSRSIACINSAAGTGLRRVRSAQYLRGWSFGSAWRETSRLEPGPSEGFRRLQLL
jgi:hypothetical protein